MQNTVSPNILFEIQLLNDLIQIKGADRMKKMTNQDIYEKAVHKTMATIKGLLSKQTKTEDGLKICHILMCNYAQECEIRYGSDFYKDPALSGDIQYYDELLRRSYDSMTVLGGFSISYQPRTAHAPVSAGIILDGYHYLPIGHPLNDKKYFQNNVKPAFDKLPEEYLPDSWEEMEQAVGDILNYMEDFLGLEHPSPDHDQEEEEWEMS